MLGLDEVRNELLNEIDLISDEDANRKPFEDGWSIAQVIEHIHLVERAIASQLKHGLFEESETPFPTKPLDPLLDRTKKVKVFLSHLEPKEEFQTLDSLKKKLGKSREQLREAYEQLDPHALTHKAAVYPPLGLLPLSQWIEVAAAHEKRHIKQIREIKKTLFKREN
ncbi:MULTISPECIES: DinB family protein [unclassified Thermoactinomyces]|jgi:DinB superfamily|uniref:DinB family protein n=1 Tax=unclassified Thermoactinomyces TaxID=2634588 RepID=UPI0018DD9831|nr:MULTISPECIES: DinB family protein [unclassified Thermoactinomyces]MBH8603127.1 DinB family protein [Thermoactinomyces sp. CICC 10522]MBH8607066.1 DinB family protein [Thermoactinomyces sp. CICC 10521]